MTKDKKNNVVNNGSDDALDKDWDSLPHGCFAKGTLIDTPEGRMAIEDIRAGDMVITMDNGDQPVRWVGKQSISQVELTINPKLAPICILAGALGHKLPSRNLYVSRLHRLLISSTVAERMFGEKESLISAIRFTDLPGIYVDKKCKEIEYYHILLDHHEVIYANGTPLESLYTGVEALNRVQAEAREEILEIFPGLDLVDFTPPAKFIPSGQMQKKIVSRLAKNKQFPLHSYEEEE